jgi:hypothetical protein
MERRRGKEKQPDGRACQQPRSAYRREGRKQQKHHQPATREGMRAAWQRLSLGARCRAGFFQGALSKKGTLHFWKAHFNIKRTRPLELEIWLVISSWGI